jgi:hypothetical protein
MQRTRYFELGIEHFSSYRVTPVKQRFSINYERTTAVRSWRSNQGGVILRTSLTESIDRHQFSAIDPGAAIYLNIQQKQPVTI